MRRKLVTASLGIILCLSLGWAVQAQVSIEDALKESGLVGDVGKVGVWFNTELGKHLGFYAGSGMITPRAPLGGLPHFEIGIGAGADFATIDIGGFPTAAEDLGVISQDLPIDQLPFSGFPLPLPLWALHADLGVFGGIDVVPALVKMLTIDVGGKFGYLPRLDFGSGAVESTLYGGEVRVGILQDQLLVPGLALSLTYEGVSGGFSLTQKEFIKNNTISVPVTVDGASATINGSISGDIALENTYNASAVGGRLMLSKNLLFLLPYVGVGMQFNSGEVNTTIKPTVTFTNTNSTGLDAATFGQTVTLEAKDTKDIGTLRATDLRLIAGMELRILILGIGLEWNGTPDFTDNFVGLGVRVNI